MTLCAILEVGVTPCTMMGVGVALHCNGSVGGALRLGKGRGHALHHGISSTCTGATFCFFPLWGGIKKALCLLLFEIGDKFTYALYVTLGFNQHGQLGPVT